MALCPGVSSFAIILMVKRERDREREREREREMESCLSSWCPEFVIVLWLCVLFVLWLCGFLCAWVGLQFVTFPDYTHLLFCQCL